MWGVGSQAGQDDVIPFVVTAQQCGVGVEDKNLFLTEGHAYFITVKVCTLNVLMVKLSRFMLCTCVMISLFKNVVLRENSVLHGLGQS
jgi:hypothetical protein